jgi:hypothetical protein
MGVWRIGVARWARRLEDLVIASEVAAALTKAGVISGDRKQEVVAAVLESRVGKLIEFSRAIHAEMHAILSALQASGSRVAGSSLYCTTYPCHSCARHIVHDAISEKETDASHVRVLPYDGVAPSKYLDLFEMKRDSRKKAGALIKRKPRDAAPKCDVTLESLPALEALVVNKLKERNLIDAEKGGTE